MLCLQLCGSWANSSPGMGRGRGSPAPEIIRLACSELRARVVLHRWERQDHSTKLLLKRLHAEHLLVTKMQSESPARLSVQPGG